MLQGFREIVLADFEFEAGIGERPVPVCLVARELRSGRTFRIFQGEFGAAPPYATGPDVLFVAYYASAELGCYRALGWPMPERILDLFTEFRDRTNGLSTPAGAGLLGALAYFGLDGIGATEKKEIQQAIGSGAWQGRYSPDEILDYCQSDIDALERLLLAMLPRIDLPRALLRGRYMAAASAMESNGTPIDTYTLARLREGWTGIQDRLITAIDASYHVYEGRSFRASRFADWLIRRGIPWRCWKAAPLIFPTAYFGRWPRPTPKSRRFANCAAHFQTCASTILRSAVTGEIARCCRHSALAPGAISPAIPSLFLARVSGCGG
jgi:hypothetical protein